MKWEYATHAEQNPAVGPLRVSAPMTDRRYTRRHILGMISVRFIVKPDSYTLYYDKMPR